MCFSSVAITLDTEIRWRSGKSNAGVGVSQSATSPEQLLRDYRENKMIIVIFIHHLRRTIFTICFVSTLGLLVHKS